MPYLLNKYMILIYFIFSISYLTLPEYLVLPGLLSEERFTSMCIKGIVINIFYLILVSLLQVLYQKYILHNNFRSLVIVSLRNVIKSCIYTILAILLLYGFMLLYNPSTINISVAIITFVYFIVTTIILIIAIWYRIKVLYYFIKTIRHLINNQPS